MRATPKRVVPKACAHASVAASADAEPSRPDPVLSEPRIRCYQSAHQVHGRRSVTACASTIAGMADGFRRRSGPTSGDYASSVAYESWCTSVLRGRLLRRSTANRVAVAPKTQNRVPRRHRIPRWRRPTHQRGEHVECDDVGCMTAGERSRVPRHDGGDALRDQILECSVGFGAHRRLLATPRCALSSASGGARPTAGSTPPCTASPSGERLPPSLLQHSRHRWRKCCIRPMPLGNQRSWEPRASRVGLALS